MVPKMFEPLRFDCTLLVWAVWNGFAVCSEPLLFALHSNFNRERLDHHACWPSDQCCCCSLKYNVQWLSSNVCTGLSSSVRCMSDWWSGGVCSIPAGLATFFHRDWSWTIFYGHSLPSTDSRKAVVSFWWKNVHKYWLTAKRTKPAQEKVWLGNMATLDMTLMSRLGRKTSTNKSLNVSIVYF